jgi:hypothetical protein
MIRFLAAVVFLLPSGILPAILPQPEEIIRKVARRQRESELQLAAYTFDQVEARTEFDSKGRPSKTERRLFYYFSSETPGQGTRELVEIDGRSATPEEKQKALDEDSKRLRSRGAGRAEGEGSRPQSVQGEEDPLVGPRRLSDLLSRYEFQLEAEEVVEGRPAYVISFRPRAGLSAASMGDRALNALGGTAWIDASEFQIMKVEAHLVEPLKVGGGLLANLKSAGILYEAKPVSEGAWLPCLVEFRFAGKTAVFFRLDRAVRFEFSNFRSFGVETESKVTSEATEDP